jgi:3-oxoacyl-[acyl-carrier protein] reductase
MGEDKLTGKVAIVFGGSRGIGAAAARRLAKEGANVGLTYVSAPDKAADTVRAIEDHGRQRRSNGDPRRRHPGGSPPWSSRHRCRQRGYPTTGRSSSRKVITIGSNTAVRSGYPGSSVYAMTKDAVAVMVKGMAVDLAPRGITVNNIQPGPTRTDMIAGHIDSIMSAIPTRLPVSSATWRAESPATRRTAA